jgi:hypothetical protein
MYLVAWGVTGLGDLISETESGRPLGMSTERLRLSRRDSRLEEDDEECLSFEEWDFELEVLDEECFEDRELSLEEEDLCEDFSEGTSRMFKIRPVVGSVVDDCPGSWETWYPSMM